MTAPTPIPNTLARIRTALAERYRVDRELGAGGMATVYLANDIRHDREVAIKVLHTDIAGALGHDRFTREIKLAASLTHPHILPLYDSGEVDGILFFVMPVMRGQTLCERLQLEGKLSIDAAIRHAVVSRPVPVVTNCIAVLPFVNMSADLENEYFTDGLTEEIITDLSRIRTLRVTSRTSSAQHKGSVKSVREIGSALNVHYLRTGSVRRAGPALRIAAQLVDATDDRQMWGDKFSGTMDEVFDLQERVSREIVAALGLTLSADEDRRLGARGLVHASAMSSTCKRALNSEGPM